MLNSAELLLRAPASARNRSPAYLCRSWTEQIRSTADLLEVNTETKVKPIGSGGVEETDLVESRRESRL